MCLLATVWVSSPITEETHGARYLAQSKYFCCLFSVIYEDIVPSTDLPPLVEGELRCFLFVTIGELVWGTTATHKLPPASPVYIRLRWWGEASNGTYFR